MSPLTLLDRFSQDPLRTAHDGRAIGYLGWNIPVELILAADALPVQLGVGAVTNTSLADRFLESSFSGQSRLVAQQWLAGQLDHLEAVVFSRSDDSAQRLYYYLCELQRVGECKGPRPLLYDLASIKRETSLEHTIESTKLLAAELGTQQSQLPTAMQRVATRSGLLEQLATLRASEQVPAGSVAHRVLRAAHADRSAEFDQSLQLWLAAPELVKPKMRVMLVGSVPSDERLHAAIEANGAVVVAEINEAHAVGLSSKYALSTRSIEAIAQRCHEQTAATRALLDTPAQLLNAARSLSVDGVIVWMLATDTGLAWEAPRIENALREAQLPALALTSQPDVPDAQTLSLIDRFAHTPGAQ